MKKENLPAIRGLDSVTERQKIQLTLDADIMALIKILASLKGDSVNNLVNDIIRSFADRNHDVLNDFKSAAMSTYDKIKW